MVEMGNVPENLGPNELYIKLYWVHNLPIVDFVREMTL
jgi:hypothetical protein